MSANGTPEPTDESSSRAVMAPVAHVTLSEADSLLATMLVRVLLPSRQVTASARALCDSGSQLNLVTLNCVQKLGLNFQAANIHVTGVGEKGAMRAHGYLDVEIIGLYHIAPAYAIRIIVVPKITSVMPLVIQPQQFVGVLSHGELADPSYWHPGPIDMLLGIGLWNQIVDSRILREKVGVISALAQQTALGWVVTTHHSHQDHQLKRVFHVKPSDEPHHALLEKLDASIRLFWELESIPEQVKLSKEDEMAEAIFVSTHSRDASGRYVVKIPFKKGPPLLGDSRRMALRQYERLERRLESNPAGQQFVREFFQDYLDEGHMILAPPAPADPARSYYAPYHMLMTGKPRVVFNLNRIRVYP